MTIENTIRPIAINQRIVALDVTRGFALFGILLMNIEYFTRPLQGLILGFDKNLSDLDYAVNWLTHAFVQGKFWTMFSMLFGMGFAVMQMRCEKHNISFAKLYSSRMLLLLFIGFIHAVFIWPGDILMPYAITGFVMILFFKKTTTSRLWKYALLFFTLPLILQLLGGLYGSSGASDPEETALALNAIHSQYDLATIIYGSGSYLEVTGLRFSDMLTQLSWLPFSVFMFLSVFLFGSWLFRSGIMQNPEEHESLFIKTIIFGLPLGTLLSVYAMQYIPDASMLDMNLQNASAQVVMMIANVLLCLTYMSAIIILSSKVFPGLATCLAPVGRMALSNYILQSIFFTTLFYGYALGLWGQVPRGYQPLLVIAFFILQTGISRWWMSRFNFGPLEWIWRRLTYGKIVSTK